MRKGKLKEYLERIIQKEDRGRYAGMRVEVKYIEKAWQSGVKVSADGFFWRVDNVIYCDPIFMQAIIMGCPPDIAIYGVFKSREGMTTDYVSGFLDWFYEVRKKRWWREDMVERNGHYLRGEEDGKKALDWYRKNHC